MYRLRLVALTIAFSLVFKIVKLSSPALIASTWGFETCIWLWTFALTAALGRVGQVLFAAWYPLNFTLGFFSTWFFRDALLRKYSLLDMGFDAFRYFLGQVVPFKVTALYAAALVGLCVLARFVPKVPLPWRPFLAGLAVATGIAWVAALNTPLFANPLWDLSADVAEVWRHPRLSSSDAPPKPPQLLDRSERGPVHLETRFKRVLVFVMESIPLRTFLDSRAALAPDSFFNRVGPHARFYSNVFTANMDSRTGLLALLTSRLVPYYAYTDLDMSRYKALSDARSLVDLMRDNGYHSVLATSQVLSEAVVRSLHWDESLVLSETDKAEARKTHLCFCPYQFEDSCEDKVMLPRLYERLDQNEKVFWVQQLVWGHTTDYSNATKKTDVQYYGELLDELVAHLEQRGQLDDTLIVVTSDHGPRDKAAETQPTSYSIPMLFYAPSLEGQQSAALHSQIDFKDLLLASLTGNDASVATNDFVMFVGPTHSSIVGAVTASGDFMVLKNRPWAKYALRLANLEDGGTPHGDESPAAFVTLLDDYRAYFQSTVR